MYTSVSIRHAMSIFVLDAAMYGSFLTPDKEPLLANLIRGPFLQTPTMPDQNTLRDDTPALISLLLHHPSAGSVGQNV